MDPSASEREEGEISDDYEMVSDESINVIAADGRSGKSIVPAQELIRTISLSSVSDNYSGDEEPYVASTAAAQRKQRTLHNKRKCPKRKALYDTNRKSVDRRRNSYHKPKRKKFSDASDSGSESDYTNKSLKRQLKEAVQVTGKNNIDKCTNSLQTRLQRMINPNYSTSKRVLLEEEDEELLALRDIALLSTQKKEEDEMVQKKPANQDKLDASNDQELINLRIDALKSAVLKKHQNRKQKKPNSEQAEPAAEADDGAKSVGSPVIPDIENLDQIPLPPSPAKATEEEISEVIENKADEVPSDSGKKEESIEEDEDVMRAILLASMSKKITTTTLVTSNTVLKDTANNKGNKLVTVLPSAPIKKIIINVNSESDSDLDESTSSSPKNDENKLLRTDDIFDKNLSLMLRQARENVEKKSPSFSEDLSLDKSVVKLLPRSQQAEYKKLKHRLLVLEKKVVKKPNSAAATGTVAATGPKKIAQKSSTLAAGKIGKSASAGGGNKAKSFKVNNLLKNKIQLKQQQQQQQQQKAQPIVNVQERCQEKINKYEVLEPLMRQIDEVRKKRDEEQTAVQNLLSQLKVARNRLSTVHQHFTSLVQKLVTAKKNIDEKCDSNNPQQPLPTTTTTPSSTVTTATKTLCTSTPTKRAKDDEAEDNSSKQDQLEISQIDTIDPSPMDISLDENENEGTELIVQEVIETSVRISTIDDNVGTKCDEDVEEKKLASNNNDDDDHVKKSSCLPYVSPLMHMNDRQGSDDPFQIICPYELQGVCRDADCKFQHCSTTSPQHDQQQQQQQQR